MTRYYPAYLDVAGRPCTVIGGGNVAERKVRELAGAGARVTLVSPTATPFLAEQARHGEVRWVERAYVPGDLAGAFLAVAATDDGAVNGEVRAEATTARVLLNVVDAPALCDFIAPAVVERGAVTVAISTAGKSPALARKLREAMDGTQPAAPEEADPSCRCLRWADTADVLEDVRAELRSQAVTVPAQAWQSAMDARFLREAASLATAPLAKHRLRETLLAAKAEA